METAIDKVREMTAFASYPPGTSMIYHVGFLCKDRERGKTVGEVRRRAEAVNTAGNIARELSEEGRVHLTQRRLGPEIYEYIATRSSRK